MITEINTKRAEIEVIDGFLCELKFTVCSLILYVARVYKLGKKKKTIKKRTSRTLPYSTVVGGEFKHLPALLGAF